MDPSNLDVTVEPHGDGGLCLRVNVFLRTGEIEAREMQGYFIGAAGPWKDAEEAEAARDALLRWWAGV